MKKQLGHLSSAALGALMYLLVALLGAPLSGQGPASKPTTGYVDPTVATFNLSHPMVACDVACSTALINQNTDALQAAIALAGAGAHPWIHLPAGRYPIMRGGVGHNLKYGVVISNLTGVVFDSPGAIIEGSGSCGQGDYYMVQVSDGSSNVRFLPGLTFSFRDLSNCSEHTHDIELGFGTPADNVQIVGVSFVEQFPGDGGKAGDCVNITGGSDASHLVSRVVIADTREEGHRSGVGFQHGSAMVDIYDNVFGPSITDQAIDHEPTGPGGNAEENIVGNLIERSGSVNIVFTMSGHDTAPAQFNFVGWNLIKDGTINAGDIHASWFVGNVGTVDLDVNSDANIEFFRDVADIWLLDNFFQRGVRSQGGLINLAQNNGVAPKGVVIQGNRLKQYAGGGLSITCVAQASMLDTDWITVSDGVLSKDYEFDKAGDGVTGGRVQVNISTDVTGQDVCTRLDAAITANQPSFTETLIATKLLTSYSLTLTGGQGGPSATEHVVNAGFAASATGVSPAIELDGVSDFWVLENSNSYGGVVPDSGSSTGYVAYLARSQLQPTSGWYYGNRAKRDLQTDGVTQAARMLTGLDASTDTFSHIGHVSVRDNAVDGAKETYLMTQTNLDAGPPVISGNVGLNVTTDNLPTQYVLEPLGATETVASGAISPSRAVSFLTATGAGTTHNLPDGVAPLKSLRWLTGGGDDTLTISDFADGSAITVSNAQLLAGPRATLAWDGTHWYILSFANLTVVP